MFSQFQQHLTVLNYFAKVETTDLSHLECIRITLETLTKINNDHILELNARQPKHTYEPSPEIEDSCSPQYDDLADYALEEYSYSIPESQRYGEPLVFSSVSPENIDELSSEVTSPTFVSQGRNQSSEGDSYENRQTNQYYSHNIDVKEPCPNVTIRRNKQWNSRTMKTSEPEYSDKSSNFIPFADQHIPNIV